VLDDVQSTENISVEESKGKNPTKIGGDQNSNTDIRSSLSCKAARIFDESEYSEEEFISMLKLYDETMKSIELGSIVNGKVILITNDSVIVDIGFKSEGSIPISEFGANPDISAGDNIEVFLDDLENKEGQMVLSKQKADFMKVWDKIKEIYDNNEEIDGRLVRRIKGGIVVDLMGVDAFLPGSQIDIRQVKNFDQYIGEMCRLRIIKINKIRRNIVVSRRAVIEEKRAQLRETVLEDLEIGQVREGSVKNITDFGVFIDLGGVDGLLHITDMSWGRINHPSELVSIGDTINVKILNYEDGKTRISLGTKQLTPYPWDGVEDKYSEGSIVKGKVVSTTDYGAFVELEHGIEGLVHISEMSWTQHVKHPSKIVNIGDEVDCKVLSVDKAEEKISLGIKQLEPDPWETIDERHPIRNHVSGKVRNLTNFGAFVEIEEGIDGLVHISDMSWTKRIKHPSEVMKKGDVVEVVILDIDKNNRRISLGHKQIYEDPWSTLEEKFAEGMNTEGTVIRILDRGVVVGLGNHIEGFVPTFQLGQDIKKPAEAFVVGDELPLKVIEFEKEQRKIILSVREYFKDREKAEFDEFREKYKPKPVTIGDEFGKILDASVEQKTDTDDAVKDKESFIVEEKDTTESVVEPEKADLTDRDFDEVEEVKALSEDTASPEDKEETAVEAEKPPVVEVDSEKEDEPLSEAQEVAVSDAEESSVDEVKAKSDDTTSPEDKEESAVETEKPPVAEAESDKEDEPIPEAQEVAVPDAEESSVEEDKESSEEREDSGTEEKSEEEET